MSTLIHILPPTLANKIAAGEVIQRPSSAVKELLENALDAGASTLTVQVRGAGSQLIQVIDDGDGMGPEDAVLAFQRHATSKIRAYEDLLQIRTLGFRGEALASMAAVAHVELKTRRADDDTATMVRIEGGELVEVTPCSAPKGTTIALKNLFYNTPARRKFMKSDATEFKHIFDAVQRVAIAHPEIAVTLRSEEEIVLQCRPGTSARRIADVFGEKLAGGVFPFEDRNGPVRVHGFLCRPAFARKGRTEQYLYLNRRPIVSKSLQHAVFQAYENMLEKGSFPFFVLFLEVDPTAVDVNVHPAKSEVKFEDESGMYRLVLSAVRRALSEHNLTPSLALRSADAAPGPDVRFQTAIGEGGVRPRDWESLFAPAQTPADRIAEPSSGTGAGLPGPVGAEPVRPSPSGMHPPPSTAPIWQVHNKYIIVATSQGLMVIDQHAAHERVLYERAVGKFAREHNRSQQLLFPHTMECSPGDAALIQGLIPDLESLGFSVRLFGKNAVIVDGVPVDVRPGEEGKILPQVIDLFKEDDQSLQLLPRERLAKSFSCRAAIKAGEPLNEPEMRALVEQLFGAEIPFVCPHGRPVMITLSLGELDRRFGRTS